MRYDAASCIYGDCTPGDQGGCLPPLEIQTSPACDDWYSQFNLGVPDGPIERPPLTRRRGVPVALLDLMPDEIQIQLYTGDVTVTISTDTRDRAERAARALRAVPGSPDGVGA